MAKVTTKPALGAAGLALLANPRSQMKEIEARAWKYMQKHHVFDVPEMQSYLAISVKTTRKLIRDFEIEGKVKALSGGGGDNLKRWAVAEEHMPALDRGATLLTQFWRSARRLRAFTALDLIAHCTPEVEATREEACGYAGALLRAGYLRVLQTAIPGQREARYQLISNTGPMPPREMRIRAIWDDNLGRYTYLAGVGRMGDLE